MNRKAFARYADYKDSGVEWLGEVPAHWDVKRVKDIGLLVLGKMLDKTKANNKFSRSYLKSRNIGWLKVDISNVDKMYFTYVEMKTYRLQTGDILLSEGGEVGKTAIWENNLDECYIQNSVHKLTVSQGNYPRYFLYHSFMLGHMQYYESIVNQVSIKHLTKEKLLRVQWLCPPFPEQLAIANYLDTQTANLDRQIELLEQKAAHYADLKQSLINRTVTRGLDPTVPLRDSGVEWIGQIPAHWEVKRLKDVNAIIMGQSPPSSDYTAEGLGYPFLQGNAEFGSYSPTPKVWCSTIKKSAIKNDILLSVRAPVGAVNVASEFYGIGRGLCAIRTKSNYQFWYYFIINLKPYLNSIATGSTYLAVSVEDVKNTLVILPPLFEQRDIAEYLDAKTAHIDRIIATINAKIARLQELRKTLINDVVTGKVRIVE